jgi:EAL domain-containing protein (putative c-di-GMP-specific phosphodiesterase class I)
VRDIVGDPANLAIVATIATLARNLNLEVVAEGVETDEQLDAVRTSGCGQAQGHLFSRPVAAEEIPALVTRCWPTTPDRSVMSSAIAGGG